MKEYLFTEFISIQCRQFLILFLTGSGIFILYRIMKNYLLLKISSAFIAALLEILFFIIASLFTGGVIDYCCDTNRSIYMAVAFCLGLPVAHMVIRK